MSRTMSDEPLSESRYCVFHPTKPYLFVNHEHSGNGKMMVSAFHYNEDGELELINKVDCLPKDTSAKCGQGFVFQKMENICIICSMVMMRLLFIKLVRMVY